MKKCINKTHVEGYVYQHSLKKTVSGPNSAHPGTEFISGNLDVAPITLVSISKPFTLLM